MNTPTPTQPTVEEKARFFALYLGQKILTWKHTTIIEKVNGGWFDSTLDEVFLILKPLSSISDEDAIEVAKMFCNEETAEAGRDLVHYYRSGDLISSSDGVFLTDFLRSKGYAVQYMNYSVEDQIYFGWIKLPTNKG